MFHDILDFMWMLISVPVIWCYNINYRLTKNDTLITQTVKRLDKIEEKIYQISQDVSEIKGYISQLTKT